jgi:hypothetical protein
MSRNGSTGRSWSGVKTLSLLSFLLLFMISTLAPAAFGQAKISVVLPDGTALAPTAPALSAAAPKAAGSPADTTVAPITELLQANFEGDCGFGCTQNTPSIVKSNNDVMIGYQSSWGLFQAVPTHVGLYNYSKDAARTWLPAPGSLMFVNSVDIPLAPLGPQDQILGPPAMAADGNGNFYYAAEYSAVAGGVCSIVVGSSYRVADAIFFNAPNPAVASFPGPFGGAIPLPGFKFVNPRIALDKKVYDPTTGDYRPLGRLYLTYTAVSGGPGGSCGTLDEPGDLGVTSIIFAQYSDDGGATWVGFAPIAVSVPGPGFVDGADIAVDSVNSNVFIAYEELDPSAGLVGEYRISGNVWAPDLSAPVTGGPSATISNANPVGTIAGYTGQMFNFVLGLGYGVFPQIHSFPAVASSPLRANEYYVVWHNDASATLSVPFGNGGDPDILFSRVFVSGPSPLVQSTTPVRVNDNLLGDGTAQFMPAIAVRSDDNLIKVAFYDRRNSFVEGGVNTLTDVYVAESKDRGNTFEPNVRITPTGSDWDPMIVNNDLDPNMGVRIGAAMDADHIYLAWTGVSFNLDTLATSPGIFTTYAQNIASLRITPDSDFGSVCPAETKSVTFDIYNTGTSDLVISSIVTADGLPNPNFSVNANPALPVTVGPGSFIEFTVTFTSLSTDTGPFSTTFLINSNDPNAFCDTTPGCTAINVAAFVVAPTYNVSTQALAFGGVPWDNANNPGNYSKTLPFTITNTGTCPVVFPAVTGIVLGVSITDYTESATLPLTLQSGSNYTFDVTFDPTEAGNRSSTMTLTPDLPAVPALVTVALSGTGLSGIATFSGSLDFGCVPVGNLNPNYFKDMVYTVTNTGGANLVIQAVNIGGANAGEFTVLNPTVFPVIVAPGTSYGITIRFTPTAGGTRTATLTLTVADVAGPLVVPANPVVLTGDGCAPEAAVSGSLAFGGVPWDNTLNKTSATKDLMLTIKNIGKAVLEVISITSNNADFTIPNFTPNSAQLQPATSMNVMVRFDPSSVGAKTANITVTTNALTTPVVTLQATGEGVDPIPVMASLVNFGGVPWEDSLNPGKYFKDMIHTITNSGFATLEITAVAITQPVAGEFTLLDPSAFPVFVAPGTSYNFQLRFNPIAAGTRSATMTVTTNVGVIPATPVSLQGEGLAAGVLVSGSLAFGGVPWEDALNPNNYKDLVINVKNTGNAVLSITGITSTGANAADFTIPNFTAATLQPGTSMDVVVRFNPSAAGARSATITVSTNVGDVTVGATGEGLVARQVIASTLAFGGVPWEDSLNPSFYYRDLPLTITNFIGGATLEISGVTVGGTNAADFTVLAPSVFPVDLAPGSSYDVIVRFNPGAAGARSATLTLTTNIGVIPAIPVALTGQGLAAGVAVSGSLAFGGVPWEDALNPNNNFKDLQINVKNTGNAVLNVTSITSTSTNAADFTIPNFSTATLQPGTNMDVIVRFNPSAAGARSATIEVETNVGDVEINATGEGLVARPIMLSTVNFAGVPFDDATNPSFYYKDLTHTITNSIGGATLSITAVTIAGANAADFTLLDPSQFPVDLAPGSSYNFNLRFNPSAAGVRNATMTVTTNVGTIPATPVALTGVGLGPTVLVSGTLEFGGVAWEDALNPGLNYKDLVINVKNTGNAKLVVTGITSTGANAADFTIPNFTVAELQPSTSMDVIVRFNPSAAGARTATITVVTNADPSSVSLTATGEGLVAVPQVNSTFDFDGVPVTDAANPTFFFKDLNITVNNSMGGATLHINSITIAGANAADFTVINPSKFPVDVWKGTNYDVTVRFNPSAEGTRTATLTLNTNVGAIGPVNLTGVGYLGRVDLAPAPAVDFGTVVVGFDPQCSKEKTVVLTSSGTGIGVRITSISIVDESSPGSFTIVQAPRLPYIVPAGTSFPIIVKFTPQTVERKITARLEVVSDAGTVFTDLCGEGVNTGIRLVVYDKMGTPLDGENGYVAAITITSKGLKSKVNQKFKVNELPPQTLEGCSNDITFHAEYELPPTQTSGPKKASYKLTVKYFIYEPSKGKFVSQKYTEFFDLPGCDGFYYKEIQSLR